MAGRTSGGAALAVLAAAGALGWLGKDVLGEGVRTPDAVAALVLGAVALGFLYARLARHFRTLERLTAALASHRERDTVLREVARSHGGELGELAAAVADALSADRHGAMPGPAGGLPAVLAALDQPVIVAADGGRIAAVSPAARRLFGEGAAPGTELRLLVERPQLFRALEQARLAGAPVAARLSRPDGSGLAATVADLGLGRGCVLAFSDGPTALPAPPFAGDHPAGGAAVTAAMVPAATQPLATARYVVLRAEWDQVGGQSRLTGLATVHLSGPRVFPSLSLDFTMMPPAQAFAGERQGGGRPFAAVWPALEEDLRGAVLLGFEMERLAASLGEECRLAGLPRWQVPAALDLGRLAAALDPTLGTADESGCLNHFVIDTTLVPARRLAALASRLLERLIGRGVGTVGAAMALSASAAAGPPSTPAPPDRAPEETASDPAR